MFLCSTQYNQSYGERPVILKPDFKNTNAALENKNSSQIYLSSLKWILNQWSLYYSEKQLISGHLS